MDRTVRQRVRGLPAEQKLDAQNKGTPIQDHSTQRQPSLHSGGHGPNHRTPKKPRARQHTDHRRSRVLTRGHLPPMSEVDHGAADRPPLLSASLPMVRTPSPTDLGPRPALHLPFWARARQRIGDLLELVNGVSPSDRWADRTKEPVGRTVPQTLIDQSARLGHDAPPGHADPQQRPEFDHRSRPGPSAPRPRTRSNPGSDFDLRQPRSKGTSRPLKATEEASHHSAKQNSQ